MFAVVTTCGKVIGRYSDRSKAIRVANGKSKRTGYRYNVVPG